MELFTFLFPVSGVETYLFIPPVVSCLISFFTSMSGVSGAFLLLPFQMSILNFSGPSVTPTNLLFNIVAIPSGLYRYIREKRMAWTLSWTIAAGTVPGVLAGYYIRVLYLPDPKTFKLFVGTVLIYIGYRLLRTKGNKTRTGEELPDIEKKFRESIRAQRDRQTGGLFAGLPPSAVVRTISVSITKTEYEFWGERFSFNTLMLFGFSLCIGIIGGIYGIGGGAIIAPFCVTFFHLPVYTIAGATLMGTLITSISGIIFYSAGHLSGEVSASPDWLLGILFGIGGFVGMYLGARAQKYVPQHMIKLLLGVLVISVAVKYIFQYF